jgi:hypothetical protein
MLRWAFLRLIFPVFGFALAFAFAFAFVRSLSLDASFDPRRTKDNRY